MPRLPPARAPRKTRIIAAAHERLAVGYSTRDSTVYLLIPPGEDPRTVLRAARLVLHDDTYRDLAAYLGVAPNWRIRGLRGARGDGARRQLTARACYNSPYLHDDHP